MNQFRNYTLRTIDYHMNTIDSMSIASHHIDMDDDAYTHKHMEMQHHAFSTITNKSREDRHSKSLIKLELQTMM